MGRNRGQGDQGVREDQEVRAGQGDQVAPAAFLLDPVPSWEGQDPSWEGRHTVPSDPWGRPLEVSRCLAWDRLR